MRYSDDLWNMREYITGVWSLFWQGCIFHMMYRLRIALPTTNMESQTFDEAICDSSYEESLPFP